MNKLEANISLFAITFFAAIQYAFLTDVSTDVSQFLFLGLTNLVGFVISFLIFFGELFRLDKKQIFQSMILAVELVGFNFFLLFGSSGVDSTVTVCVLSSYFIFIPLIMLLVFRKKIRINSWIGVVLVLIGLFLVLDAKLKNFININIIFLVLADLFFAVYVMTVEKFAIKSNPSILAMGQMFFAFVFSSILFVFEYIIKSPNIVITTQSSFWGSVIFIGIFIRGLYGIVQIYAQRYVSALNTSLIFSTEIIITLLTAPLIYLVFGIEYQPITVVKILGSIVMIIGILVADSGVIDRLKRSINSAK